MEVDNVVDSFDSLRQKKRKVQISSGVNVLNHLWTKQKEHGLENSPCRELQLGIERIIRGLGAPRSNSRKGHFLTFVGICDLFSSSTITFQLCIDTIEKELQEFTTKAEENDVYKGKLLAYGGLIYSGKALHADHKEIKYLLTQLGVLVTKKSYLALGVYWFLADWINRCDEKVFQKSMWNSIKAILLEKVEKEFLHWYNVLFVINKRFPHVLTKEILTKLIGSSSIYDKSNLESIGKILMYSQSSILIDAPIFQEMLTKLVNDKVFMKTMWSIINENLSSTKSTVISYTFRLFSYCSLHLENKNMINYTLKPSFVKILSSRSDGSLEEDRLQAIKTFSKIISEKNVLVAKTQINIVERLFFYPGNFEFLNGPGIKLFQMLANNFDEATVKSVFKCFLDVLSGSSAKTVSEIDGKVTVQKSWQDEQKLKASNIIMRLINHPAVITCIDWKIEQMKVIIDSAFFKIDNTPKFSENVKRCFFSALDIKFGKLKDMCSFLNGIVLYIDSKINSNCTTNFEFGKVARKEWKKVLKTISRITSNDPKTDNEKFGNSIFHAMFLLMGLMLFDDPDTAMNNLKELHVIYEKMCVEFEDKSEDQKTQDLHWTDVVTEFILSLLTYNSHFQRNVISKVFVFLCPLLSARHIQQILAVLNPNEDNLQFTDDNEEDDLDDVKEKDEDWKNSDKVRTSVQGALMESALLTDTESIDLNDLDEEEGKRLDKSLSMAFKQMKALNTKSRSVELKQLSDFRIRVLDLLEIWAKRAPELNLIFDAMVTALMLLENSLLNKGDLQLQTRLKSFIEQLTSINNFTMNETFNAKKLVAIMKKLMDKDVKTAVMYINMSQQITDCCTFILKLSLRDLKSSKKMRPLILEAYKSALQNFFNKTNSIVPVNLFKTAFLLPWEGSFDLVEDIVNYIMKPDVKQFHLLHAFNFLQVFLQNRRLLTTDICSKYSNKIRQIAQTFANNVNMFERKPEKVVINQFIQICLHVQKLNVASDIIEAIDCASLRKKYLNSKRKLENGSSESVKMTSEKDENAPTSREEDDSKLDEPVKKKRKDKKKILENGSSENEDALVLPEENDIQQDISVESVKKKKPKDKKRILENGEAEDTPVPTEENIPKDKSVEKKRKAKNKQNSEAELKKKSKSLRSEEFSKGLEDGIFGTHLFDNNEFMNGEIEAVDD